MNLKQMEKESDCIETIFQSYITLKSTRTVFLFFEGKDDFKYYWCRLAPFIGEQGYETYICRSKGNVLQLYNMIHFQTKPRDNEKICYFVDNDYEKSQLQNEDIYVTPTYSIENLYISDSAIKNMLKGEWGLSGEMLKADKDDFEIAFNYLKGKRDEVINSIIYANAWYSLQYNKSKGNLQHPKLSAIKEYKTIKDVKDKATLEGMVANSIKVSEEEVEAEIAYLEQNPEGKIRGKYFEQTMPSYFMKVFQDSNKKNNREMFSKRRRVNINVGEDNMVSVLSQYADSPSNLMAYITKIFNVNI